LRNWLKPPNASDFAYVQTQNNNAARNSRVSDLLSTLRSPVEACDLTNNEEMRASPNSSSGFYAFGEDNWPAALNEKLCASFSAYRLKLDRQVKDNGRRKPIQSRAILN
jgi:hypothetical protein